MHRCSYVFGCFLRVILMGFAVWAQIVSLFLICGVSDWWDFDYEGFKLFYAGWF